ncbi:MAG: sigma-70 family RNA polymerase sigma factor [bacterium]|nr:sigma-70 family RNA polymerase sigma factor [bacterium]
MSVDLPHDLEDLEDGAETEIADSDTVDSGVADSPVATKVPGDSALVSRDPLDRYFAEVAKYPLLSREEEKALALRVQEDGDPDAAEKLVLSNLRLVIKIAMDYRRVWTNVLDLIQEGNVGLLQGVRRYDPTRGVKLSSYAAYWIRAYILKYLIDNIRLVRVGSSRAERKLFFQLNRAKRELEHQGLDPEPKLIAEKLGVKEPEVVDMQHRLAQGDLSIDAPARREESDSASFGDFIPTADHPTDEIVGEQEMRATFMRHIRAFSADLDEREGAIVRDRLIAEEPRTLQDLGDEFGLTRERVRQIEKALIDRLREYLKDKLVDFDLWSPSN